MFLLTWNTGRFQVSIQPLTRLKMVRIRGIGISGNCILRMSRVNVVSWSGRC